MKSERIVLSIETGIRGGSLSLLRDGFETDGWVGEEKVSKAEDVLAQVAEILRKNKVSSKDINLITVSQGPGSITGLRIGEALARGLRKSSECLLKTVPTLKAMAGDLKYEQKVISAVPHGSEQLYWQSYCLHNEGKITAGELHLSYLDFFFEHIKSNEDTSLVLQQFLYNKFKGIFSQKQYASGLKVESVENLARVVGQYGFVAENKASDNGKW